VLIAAQRQGSVRSQPVDNDKIATFVPLVRKLVAKSAHIMSDEHYSYRHAAAGYATHSTINHLRKEYARGDVHTNTAESFNAMLERVKWGVFHYMSSKHLRRYLNEIEFRWNHCTCEEKITKNGNKKKYRKPLPFLDLLTSLLKSVVGKQIRRTQNNGIRCFNNLIFSTYKP